MTYERVAQLLEIEKQCLLRNRDGCDRDCARCDLVQEDKDLEEMYCIAQCVVEDCIAERPIRAVMNEDGFIRTYCPSCKKMVTEHMNFCPVCGKALDWTDDDGGIKRAE